MTAQPPGTPEDPQAAQTRAFFDAARGRIDGFVARNFSVTGSAAMHRRAFGLDLLRAPLNVVLAPIHALTRLFALIARLLRARRLAGWLDRRSFVLPTRVAAEVEARLVHELLGIKRPAKAPRGLSRQLEQAPELRQLLRDGESPGAIAARTRAAADTIAAYSGTRSAVAELTTALLTVVFGAWVFRRLTPGMVSFGPALADSFARETALSSFPLGRGAASLWYGVFPVGATLSQVMVITGALIALASVVTAFAGVIADPVQARIGLHRRRLHRLVDALETDLTGAPPRRFAANEHYYARVFDLLDIGSGLFRHFR